MSRDIGFHMVECPMCGKSYVYNSMSVYKIKDGYLIRYYCSYSCFRKAQIEKENTKEAIREQKRIQRELKGWERL